jgi:hypothetical protein
VTHHEQEHDHEQEAGEEEARESLLEEQKGKGYGADTGEREQALEEEAGES